MNKTNSKKNTRLDLRLSLTEKELLKKAAVLKHESVSDYVRVIALNEAKRVVDASSTVFLSEADRDLLLAVLDHPPEPNEALKQAMAKYLGS
jgi:uncharacterized protein (DUF1778 family)